MSSDINISKLFFFSTHKTKNTMKDFFKLVLIVILLGEIRTAIDKIFFTFMLSLLLCCMTLTQTTDSESYKIYDISAKNVFEKETLLRLSNNPKYDFFLLPRALDVPARVMSEPHDSPELESFLTQSGLEYTEFKSNVSEAVEMKNIPKNLQRSSLSGLPLNSFNSYQRFDAINNYLTELAINYSTRAIVKTVGKSYEGRSLNTITITNGNNETKKIIFVDAGIHGREWIAPAAALYIIHQLVENYADNAYLLKYYDWVVLPVVNPDGYEYSHTNERLWRKTRKPVTSKCVGTDGNRNFDFQWGGVGASSDACALTFKGKSAFSEAESCIVRDIMHSFSGHAKFYLTMHSYGNYLIYPWGYTSELPATWKNMDNVAQAGAEAIRSATGTDYTVGSSTNVLYAAAGGSDDYAHAKANIPIAITMELPAGDSGYHPSPAQIKPIVKETWIGVKAMAEAVINQCQCQIFQGYQFYIYVYILLYLLIFY